MKSGYTTAFHSHFSPFHPSLLHPSLSISHSCSPSGRPLPPSPMYLWFSKSRPEEYNLNPSILRAYGRRMPLYARNRQKVQFYWYAADIVTCGLVVHWKGHRLLTISWKSSSGADPGSGKRGSSQLGSGPGARQSPERSLGWWSAVNRTTMKYAERKQKNVCQLSVAVL